MGNQEKAPSAILAGEKDRAAPVADNDDARLKVGISELMADPKNEVRGRGFEGAERDSAAP